MARPHSEEAHDQVLRGIDAASMDAVAQSAAAGVSEAHSPSRHQARPAAFVPGSGHVHGASAGPRALWAHLAQGRSCGVARLWPQSGRVVLAGLRSGTLSISACIQQHVSASKVAWNIDCWEAQASRFRRRPLAMVSYRRGGVCGRRSGPAASLRRCRRSRRKGSAGGPGRAPCSRRWQVRRR